MNARTLLDNFDLIADAPGGVPKLRELILQLAVRGKLVPQDSKDVSLGRAVIRKSSFVAGIQTESLPSWPRSESCDIKGGKNSTGSLRTVNMFRTWMRSS